MGVTGLGDFLKAECAPGSIGLLPDEVRASIRDKSAGTTRVVQDVNPEVPLRAFRGHRIAIDVLNTFHPLKVSAYNDHIERNPSAIPADYDVVTTALGMYARRLEGIVVAGVTPVLVMDGKATKLKAKTQAKRRKVVDRYADQQVDAEVRIQQLTLAHSQPKPEPKDEEERQQQAEEMMVVASEVIELNKRVVTAIKGSTRISEQDKERIHELASVMGLPYVQAPEEAEKYCAQLVKEGYCRAAWSSDTDLAAHGCPVIIRSIAREGVARVMLLTNVLQQLHLSYEAFVDLCIMCGTDYNPNVKGFGAKRCYELIKQYGSLEAMPATVMLAVAVGRGTRQLEYRKALLYNEEMDQDWRHIRHEFLEHRYTISADKLDVDENDLSLLRDLLNTPDGFKQYSKAHSDLLSSMERMVPFTEYHVM